MEKIVGKRVHAKTIATHVCESCFSNYKRGGGIARELQPLAQRKRQA
jgi:hypothetical protein